MKLPALVLAGSLAANAVLLLTLAFKPALAPPAFRDFFQGVGLSRTESAAPGAKPRATRRYSAPKPSDKPLWSTLQSSDLRGLIANLRAAGFSPAVIRAIVSAQLEIQFRSQMAAVVGDAANRPFWQPDGAGSVTQKVMAATNEIYRERSRMMRDLFRDEFFTSQSSEVSAGMRNQYGDITRAKIDLVQRVVEDYREMTEQVRTATQGIMLPEDRAKLALLESEKLADLAAILSPQELENYQMRTSQITSRLRTPLSIMDATEAEFLALYKIHQPFQDVLYPGAFVVGGVVVSSASTQFNQRREAQEKIAEQVRAVLGEARAVEYARASDNEFQNLYRLTQRDNVPIDAAVRAYDMRNTAAAQSTQIMNDRTLNNDQKRVALQTLAQTTKAQIMGALGVNVGTAYTKSATWLNRIEQGASVTFMPGGGTSSRSLPPPGTNPNRGGAGGGGGG